MMAEAREILVWALLLGGGAFSVVAGLGLIRLPDFYTRMHAAGIADTLAAMLILAGLAVSSGLTMITVKLALVYLFIFFTSPVSSHAVANAAFTSGLKPKLADDDRAAPGETQS